MLTEENRTLYYSLDYFEYKSHIQGVASRSKRLNYAEILGFRSGTGEEPDLLGHDVAPVGNWIPTF